MITAWRAEVILQSGSSFRQVAKSGSPTTAAIIDHALGRAALRTKSRSVDGWQAGIDSEGGP
ncbi:MAG: hypothetical protein ACRDTD_22310 [Pseudonocardiaceae bacterium]